MAEKRALDNKVAIVTGASSGIGRAIALAFAAAGARVVLAARRLDQLDSGVAEIVEAGGEALAVPTDLRVESDVIELFKQTCDHFGRVDILINNAGIFPSAATDELTLAEWQQALDVNLTGAFLCSREALRVMKPRQSGRIINMGSISARVPRPNSAPYTTTKFALDGLTRSLALDARPHGIAVSIVHPGNTETQIWQGKEEAAAVEGLMPPAELAKLFVTVAALPPEINLYESIILPVSMPFLGRG